jgi:transglutaminase/protease-like cytokinesis protein 3
MKYRKLVFLIMIPAILMSGSPYESIDRHALGTPARAESSVEILAGYLVRPARNDHEKIRAIFRWITANITYDTRAAFIGSPGEGSDSILKSRKAVCDGYSTLFEMLAGAAGLRVVKIGGYAKGYDYRIGDHFDGPPNHAWNAVFLDGKWQLLDATWGSGYVDESGGFVREFDEFFFLTDPEDLKYTHFPEEAGWQLLSIPVSRAEFESYPYLKPAFFHNHLKMVSHRKGLIPSGKDLMITLDNPERADLTVRLLRNNQDLNDRYAMVQKLENTSQIRINFPEKGRYTLRIFARAENNKELYLWAMDYLAEVGNAAGSRAEFPEIFKAYHEQDAQLIVPLTGRLKKNKEYLFELIIPEAIEACIIQGKSWIPMDHGNSGFIKTVRIQSGSVQIGARFGKSRQFDILLEYTAD